LKAAQKSLATTLADLAHLKAEFIFSSKKRSHENAVLNKVIGILKKNQKAMVAAQNNANTPK